MTNGARTLLIAIAATACTPSAPAVRADLAFVNVNVVDVAQWTVVPGQTVPRLDRSTAFFPVGRDGRVALLDPEHVGHPLEPVIARTGTVIRGRSPAGS